MKWRAECFEIPGVSCGAGAAGGVFLSGAGCASGEVFWIRARVAALRAGFEFLGRELRSCGRIGAGCGAAGGVFSIRTAQKCRPRGKDQADRHHRTARGQADGMCCRAAGRMLATLLTAIAERSGPAAANRASAKYLVPLWIPRLPPFLEDDEDG